MPPETDTEQMLYEFLDVMRMTRLYENCNFDSYVARNIVMFMRMMMLLLLLLLLLLMVMVMVMVTVMVMVRT